MVQEMGMCAQEENKSKAREEDKGTGRPLGGYREGPERAEGGEAMQESE